MTQRPNRLIHETSPYLLQHAYNPVDWYPWGEEALQKAHREEKPIFLSIGYSACHWCHVMERECFENPQIAQYLNEHFVSIKVDREERPDLDELYMTAVQLLTGQGGWPLTVFLTPDLKPFFGGTYFPPEDRWGRPGFLTVLKAITALYQKEREKIVEQAEQLTQYLQALQQPRPSSELLTRDLIQRAYLSALKSFDREHGGFGDAPKFPHSLELSLLLRYWHRTRDADALHVVEFSLEKMARGGIYDQLGGGFHRYSVDAQWAVPHFEKMLYDNALLVWTYLEAYQITQKALYRRVVEETLDYVLREMTSSAGGFFASQDADSPDGEGAFYLWTPEEIEAVLGAADGARACEYFGVAGGASVLRSPYTLEEFAAKMKMTVSECEGWLARVKEKLFAARERRPKPARDEKILTAWNGLIISALARAYQVLGHEKYLHAAQDAAHFCLKSLIQDGALLHSAKDGIAKIPGYLDDYAFLILALLDLYESDFDLCWVHAAKTLSATLIEKFWDEHGGGFFFTSSDHEKLPVRPKSFYDGATPSGNSAATMALLRLAELTGDAALRVKAEQTLRLCRDFMEQAPQALSYMLSALDFYLGPTTQIAVIGAKGDKRTQQFVEIIRARFLPNKIVVVSEPGDGEGAAFIPLVRGKGLVNGAPSVYLCKNSSCQAPITEITELERTLE